ncbi:Cellobiose dehydrogenase, cytochrome [Penicillium italicum]|uniref:Cellobiose dehydrogenase, cytochrome n=1 Tax=Penicillium italicum TaxID=40296 RepID=A0A0A2KPE3_PENIT|nr:Cellobiose dehydrogenase, cytochrome [Penicillium italicum]
MYLSITVTRPRGSDKGWTAIGTGPTMAGSLMIIVYGDPLSGESPIVSIRTTNEHHQPKLLNREDVGGADLRLLQTQWQPVTDSLSKPQTYRAKVALVCYSCHLWPGSPISTTATSMPWIWAWNEDQQFSVFSYDAHLKMHKHHAGNGGWGRFYVDMSRSINHARILPSVPSINPGVRTLGTSDTPRNLSGALVAFRSRGLVHLHGVLMGLAFLVLFPWGVFMIRSQKSHAFQWHSILQLVASICAICGGVLGTVMTGGKFRSWHQAAGLVLLLALGLQGVLGWTHHVVFVRTKRQTWISYAHIWTGRAIMVVAWSNIIGGMRQQGFGPIWIALVSGIIVGQIIGLAFWVRARNTSKVAAALMTKEGAEEYSAFAIAGDEDEEGSDQDEGGSNRRDPIRPQRVAS